jgi:hypothetical protein
MRSPSLLHAFRPDHVIRNQQELLPLRPAVMLGDDRGQHFQRPRRRVTLQQQVQHGHKVTLAGAETPVQVGGLTLPRCHSGFHQPERLIKAAGQLIGDHVVLQRSARVTHHIGQLQDEVARIDSLRQIE